MPSLSYTPGTLALTGAEINPDPVRFTFTAGRLLLSGASIDVGAGLSATDGDRLPRLQRSVSYFDAQGRPTAQMQLHWQRFAERIEQRFTDVESVLAQIQQAQADAAAARQGVNDTNARLDLSASFINPVGVLTAASDGTITIAAHQRVYADATSVSVDAGSVSGFASGAFVTVYYVDAARAGGAVAYQGTTSAVAQSGNTHIVGQVSIPAAGEVAAPGSGPTAPGYYAPPFEYDPRLIEYELAG